MTEPVDLLSPLRLLRSLPTRKHQYATMVLLSGNTAKPVYYNALQEYVPYTRMSVRACTKADLARALRREGLPAHTYVLENFLPQMFVATQRNDLSHLVRVCAATSEICNWLTPGVRSADPALSHMWFQDYASLMAYKDLRDYAQNVWCSNNYNFPPPNSFASDRCLYDADEMDLDDETEREIQTRREAVMGTDREFLVTEMTGYSWSDESLRFALNDI